MLTWDEWGPFISHSGGCSRSFCWTIDPYFILENIFLSNRFLILYLICLIMCFLANLSICQSSNNMIDKMFVNMSFILAQLHSSSLFSLYGLINLPLSLRRGRAQRSVSETGRCAINGGERAKQSWSGSRQKKGWDGDKWMYLSFRSGWIGRWMSDDDEVIDLIPWLCPSQFTHNFPNGR